MYLATKHIYIKITTVGKMTRAAGTIIRDIQHYVTRYSRYHQSILTIEQFTHFGKYLVNQSK